MRIYTGELHANEAFYNPRLGRMERTQQMFRMFADERKSISTAGPGEIVAFVGLKQTVTETPCATSGIPSYAHDRVPGAGTEHRDRAEVERGQGQARRGLRGWRRTIRPSR